VEETSLRGGGGGTEEERDPIRRDEAAVAVAGREGSISHGEEWAEDYFVNWYTVAGSYLKKNRIATINRDPIYGCFR
jgi:hypothetical protein